MRLNQITVSAANVGDAWRFYLKLGLIPIVDSRPRYVRLRSPNDDATLSVQQGQACIGTTVYFECEDLDARVSELSATGIQFTQLPKDQPWLWREAELFDPAGNRIVLFHAGKNRLDPPWRVQQPSTG